MKITKNYLRKLIKEELIKEARDNTGRYNDIIPFIEYFQDDPDFTPLAGFMNAYKDFVRGDEELISAAEALVANLDKNLKDGKLGSTVEDLMAWAESVGIDPERNNY